MMLTFYFIRKIFTDEQAQLNRNENANVFAVKLMPVDFQKSFKMGLQILLLLGVTVISVHCQYDVQTIIDQTQYLQEIEKFGSNYTLKNVYPKLSNFTDAGTDFYKHRQNETVGGSIDNDLRNNTSRGTFNNSSGVLQPFNSTERFMNKTLSTMPKGVCVKEVP